MSQFPAFRPATFDQDVIAAVKAGEALCPACLGRKRVMQRVFPDFLGDQGYVAFQTCERCGGSGLDQPSKESLRVGVC